MLKAGGFAAGEMTRPVSTNENRSSLVPPLGHKRKRRSLAWFIVVAVLVSSALAAVGTLLAAAHYRKLSAGGFGGNGGFAFLGEAIRGTFLAALVGAFAGSMLVLFSYP
ncbi:MAG: hypothetical protein ABSF26_28930, partial [Thermoguttaceae bacterium]